MNRRQSVAGYFYPASCEEITRHIARFNSLLEAHVADLSFLRTPTQMIVAPHAGYEYSGFTANVAHRALSQGKFTRVVVIGPSHRVALRGASIGRFSGYETPCKTLDYDEAYALQLQEKFALTFMPQAHAEHSTETQLPFIAHYLPQAQIIEIVYGDMAPQNLAPLIEYVLKDSQTAVVISTDLSHFYTLEAANRLDHMCLKAVSMLDVNAMQTCEACGNIGVTAALMAAKNRSFEAKILDYRTSADASGDTSRVVGYMSAMFVV